MTERKTFPPELIERALEEQKAIYRESIKKGERLPLRLVYVPRLPNGIVEQ